LGQIIFKKVKKVAFFLKTTIILLLQSFFCHDGPSVQNPIREGSSAPAA
jgi:hypothetical protein